MVVSHWRWLILAPACLFTLLGVCSLHADDILLGDSHQYPWHMGTFVYINGAAQQFTLNRAIFLDQINVGVASDSYLPDQQYLFQVSTTLGPGTDKDDILMSFTTNGNNPGIPSSLTNPGQVPSYLSFAVPSVRLDPGMYYLTDALVVNNPPGDTGGSFWTTTAPLDSAVGSLGQSYNLSSVDKSNPAASQATPVSLTNPLDFQLIGRIDANELPEPTSWQLLVAGLLIIFVVRRAGISKSSSQQPHAN